MNLQEILAQDVGGPEGPGDYTDEIVKYFADSDDGDETENLSALPIVDDYKIRLRQVAEVVLASPSKLYMNSWHGSCGTTHCVGGWGIHLAGEDGKLLEELNGSEAAAYMLLGAEAHSHFYDSPLYALRWLQEVADRPLS